MAYEGNKKGQEYKLSVREKKFVTLYLEYGDAGKAVREAKFNTNSPAQYGRKLLAKPKIQKEINEQFALFQNEHIASAQEIMGFQTMVMRGLVKDQFGLDATLKDRLDASKELAKRQIDAQELANKGKENEFTIKLCWDRSNNTQEPDLPDPDDEDLLDEPTDDEDNVDGNE